MFRRQTTIGREGRFYLFLVVLVFGAAMFKEVNLLLLLAGMLFGPVVLNWYAVGASLRGLRITRKLPKTLCAGDVLSVGLRLTNLRSRRGCWDIVVEEQIERIGNHAQQPQPIHTSVLFPYVPPGQSRKAAYRGRLLARGKYRVGPLQISTGFPFGLFSRKVVVDDTETVTVLPRLGRLTRDWAARHHDTFAGADRGDRRPGPDGDFYGVREWRSGDSRRLIHWRRSARLGSLVVRQFERPRNRDVALILDLWQPEQAESPHLENVELAVSLVATVLAELCRKGGSNVLLAISDAEPQCFEGPTSAVLLQSLMEQLATVAARSEDCLPQLLAHAMQQIATDVEIVLISTRPVHLTDSRWLAAVGQNPTLHDRLRRILCIDTSGDDLVKYFHAE